MMSRTQISIDLETKRRARKRASELGISFAQYIRGLVARDLETPSRDADPSLVFDLGTSCNTDIARDKDVLVGRAVSAERGLGE
ncbi:MAG TPA: hypothetical protein VGD06_05460 [Acidobacteriota bacterium]